MIAITTKSSTKVNPSPFVVRRILIVDSPQFNRLQTDSADVPPTSADKRFIANDGTRRRFAIANPDHPHGSALAVGH
ncbi:hypothetical protein [Kolteria novifilia]|uniref:hypothetical protein n=1 Tax=Kolteria novifilia TaxID=2527975 RepID=UPI003AF33B22